MTRPFASHRLSLSRATVQRGLAFALGAACLAAIGLLVRTGSWVAIIGRTAPSAAPSSGVGPARERADQGATAAADDAENRRVRAFQEAGNAPSPDGPISVEDAGRMTAKGQPVQDEPSDQKLATNDASQADAALFAAWERLERRVATAMLRARESVVALEYTPADASPGTRRLATGVVINHEGEILSVRIDRPAAGNPSGEPATILARDSTGYRHAARWIAADAQTGLTLLRVASRAMKPIRTATVEPDLGSQVFVVGNPFGMGHSVSRGYVAGFERTLEFGSRQLGGLLQIQTPLYPGDSGAAVVNVRGEWLGMIRSGLAAPATGGAWTAAGSEAPAPGPGGTPSSHTTENSPLSIAAQDEAAGSRPDQDNGFGFAIPSSDALWVASQLRGGGTVDRAYLGVRFDLGWNFDSGSTSSSYAEPKTADGSSHAGTDNWSHAAQPTATRPVVVSSAGALLLEVLPDTPAAAGGLQPGDLIVSLNGQPVRSARELTDRLDRIPARANIQLGVMRGRGAMSRRVDLSLRTVSRPRFGLGHGSRGAQSATTPNPVPAATVSTQPSRPDRHQVREPEPGPAAPTGSISIPSSNNATAHTGSTKPVVGDRPEPAMPTPAPNLTSLPSLKEIRLVLPPAILERVEQLERRLERLEHLPGRHEENRPAPADAARTRQPSSARISEPTAAIADPLATPRNRP